MWEFGALKDCPHLRRLAGRVQEKMNLFSPARTRSASAPTDNKSAQMNSQDEKYHKARGEAPAAAAAAAATTTQANQEKK